ncbi:hypothetical protein [Trichothermofontia sp.]
MGKPTLTREFRHYHGDRPPPSRPSPRRLASSLVVVGADRGPQ